MSTYTVPAYLGTYATADLPDQMDVNLVALAYDTTRGAMVICVGGAWTVYSASLQAQLDALTASVATKQPGPTTANVDLYMDPAGNDSNDGLSALRPLLTPEAAMVKARAFSKLAHKITIHLAAGTYTGGFFVSGMRFQPTPGQDAYLEIQGTLTDAVPTTGVASGAVASYSIYTTANTGAQLNCTGANWTVNDLVGKCCEIDSGPGAGSVYPITANTATQLTLQGFAWSTSPTSASTFRIRDYASIITGGINIPNRNSTYTATTAKYAVVIDATPSSRGASVSMLKCKVTGCNGASLGHADASFEARACRFEPTASCFVMSLGGTVRTFYCEIIAPAATSAVFSCGTFGAYPLGLYIDGSWIHALGVGSNEVAYVWSSVTLYARGARFDSFATGFFLQAASAVYFQLCYFNGCTTGIGGLANGAQNPASGSIGVGGSRFDNCGVALWASDTQKIHCALTCTGSGNTTAFKVDAGGTIQIESSNAVAGNGTNDIVVEGASSTIAALRAANPQAVTSSLTGARVYQL